VFHDDCQQLAKIILVDFKDKLFEAVLWEVLKMNLDVFQLKILADDANQRAEDKDKLLVLIGSDQQLVTHLLVDGVVVLIG
jgi:hypothetical protein